MEKYSKYKDSGVKWIGDIPAHWNMLRAKNMFVRMAREVRDEDNIITCFRDGQVTLRKNRRIEGFTESFKEIGYQGIRKGDLVIHQMDAFAGSIGVSDSDGKGTPVYICLQPKDNNSNYYYAFLLREMARTGFIKSLYRGIRERSSDFRYETFAKLFLPLPPLTEQRAIVSYLDGKVGQIDTYIAKQTQQIELLKELKQAVIANAVTKGIDTNPNVKRKQSGVNWLGEIPEHWEVSKLRKHFIPRIQKVSDKDYAPLSVTKDGILPQLDTACKTDNGENRKLVRKGDYVVNSRSDRKGSGGISPFDGSVSLINIVIYPIDGEQEYYHYLFRCNNFVEEFYRNGRGIVADLWTTRYQEMKNIEIPIPPLSEQRAIVSYIEAKTASINKLIDAYEQQVERVKEYKQRLISDAVTGKINVTGKQTQTN